MSNTSLYQYRFRRLHVLIFVIVCISILTIFTRLPKEGNVFYTYMLEMNTRADVEVVNSFSIHDYIVDQYYHRRENLTLSKLGRVLYRNEPYPEINKEKKNKTFVILIWKHWKYLQQRHLYYYGKKPQDPLLECTVKNCIYTGDEDKLESADAIIIHLHRGGIPPSDHRSPSQRWIFLDDESPKNAFSLSPQPVHLKDFVNIFNWSMTYRSMSDIPVPYGRTVNLNMTSSLPLQDLIPNWQRKRRDVLVAILISNCRISYRLDIIKGLKTHIQLDAHGLCGDEELKKSCPGHFRADCDDISEYLFYLALENSKCTEYMTEKLFRNAYSKGAIPIIQGATREECEMYLPPKSYLHIDDYLDLKDLAKEIERISFNESELFSYHKWRYDFEVVNEHGFLGTKSIHLCRICEAMNYNDDAASVYRLENIHNFFAVSKLCRK